MLALSLKSGSIVGAYEIVAPLGAGGMGEVYRARDPRLGREVAIKVLPASFAASADRLRRFEQEARAAGVLNHPNLLTIFELGTHDGSPFIVSELLEGFTLRDVVKGLDSASGRRSRDGSDSSRGVAVKRATEMLRTEPFSMVRRGTISRSRCIRRSPAHAIHGLSASAAPTFFPSLQVASLPCPWAAAI